MKIANDRLNPQVLVLEDAETEIRKAVIDGFLRREFKEVTARKIKKIIERAVAKIKIPSLKETARRSLTAFADKQYDTLRAGLGGSVEIVAAVIALRGSPAARKKRTEDFVADVLKKNRNMPVPRGLQPDHYVKTVIANMDAVFSRLVEQTALDPEDVSGRNSLRNKAEMEVRYQRHRDEIADMKAKGGLWICSVHADCSDRCAPYQGRVYSMDGTSGRTEDGRKYVPLEYATQNPRDRYTTKAGRTYQNGLFGFNCFDDKTEVFTDKGWRLFRDLDGTEKIYTLSPETRQTEWQTPLRYFKQWHDGEMIWLHNKRTDIMCTPNHDLLYFTQKDKRLRFKRAAEFSAETDFLLSQNCDPVKEVEKDEVPHRGFIYCLEVPNHTLLVKRNGRIVWCGNCRHTLSPYKPKMAVPTVTKEEQQKEYEITKTQREYERRIRREKIKAVTYEKENPRKAIAARKLAREITAEYERYSRRNNRAFYPKRTQII